MNDSGRILRDRLDTFHKRVSSMGRNDVPRDDVLRLIEDVRILLGVPDDNGSCVPIYGDAPDEGSPAPIPTAVGIDTSPYGVAKAALEALSTRDIRSLLGALEREYQVTLNPDRDDNPVAGPAYGGPPPLLREMSLVLTDFKVMLNHTGPYKINVIHELRRHLSLGLVEAKRMTETTPCEVANYGESLVGAKELVRVLINAGADAEVVRG